ncbi:MAG: hypothetical protein WD512_12465 [Candidatus Paceibacterota bacterium]
MDYNDDMDYNDEIADISEINNYRFDDYLLQKIKSYLIRDLFSRQFQSICYSIKTLSHVNRKFAKNFDLLAFKLFLSSHMNNISFFPCKLVSSNVYIPVKHDDLSMIAYVTSWKSCTHCKSTLIDLVLFSHISNNYYYSTTSFHLFFCHSHYNDLLSRNKLIHWNHVLLVFIPQYFSLTSSIDSTPTVTPRLEIFLDTSSWC